MVYLADCVCPRCGRRFLAALPVAAEPTPEEWFTAPCPNPNDGNPYRFHPPEPRTEMNCLSHDPPEAAYAVWHVRKDVADALGVEAVASRCE
jgi:hypothetical protein